MRKREIVSEAFKRIAAMRGHIPWLHAELTAALERIKGLEAALEPLTAAAYSVLCESNGIDDNVWTLPDGSKIENEYPVHSFGVAIKELSAAWSAADELRRAAQAALSAADKSPGAEGVVERGRQVFDAVLGRMNMAADSVDVYNDCAAIIATALRSAAPALQQDTEAVRNAHDAAIALLKQYDDATSAGTRETARIDYDAAEDAFTTALASHTAAVTAKVREEVIGLIDERVRHWTPLREHHRAQEDFNAMDRIDARITSLTELAATIRAVAPK